MVNYVQVTAVLTEWQNNSIYYNYVRSIVAIIIYMQIIEWTETNLCYL